MRGVVCVCERRDPSGRSERKGATRGEFRTWAVTVRPRRAPVGVGTDVPTQVTRLLRERKRSPRRDFLPF